MKYFNEQVSSFAGIDQNYTKGFDDLYDLLPAGRKILYETPGAIVQPVCARKGTLFDECIELGILSVSRKKTRFQAVKDLWVSGETITCYPATASESCPTFYPMNPICIALFLYNKTQFFFVFIWCIVL